MINTQKHLSISFVHNIAMGFAMCLCRSASRLASSVCGGQVRSISTVVNRPSLVHNICLLVSRGFLYSTAAIDDDWISSEQALLRVMTLSTKILSSLLETSAWCMRRKRFIDTCGGIPFKIEDVPGNRTVTLTREHNGEHIKVVLSMPLFPDDDTPSNDDDDDAPSNESNDDDDSAVFPFVMTVTKKSGRCLELSCRKVSDEIIVDAIHVKLPGEDPMVLRDLYDSLGMDHEVLKKTINKYLEDRGLGHNTYLSLDSYMCNKMRLEYWLWVDHVKEFLEE